MFSGTENKAEDNRRKWSLTCERDTVTFFQKPFLWKPVWRRPYEHNRLSYMGRWEYFLSLDPLQILVLELPEEKKEKTFVFDSYQSSKLTLSRKMMRKFDIFAMDHVFFVVNCIVGDKHWALMVVKNPIGLFENVSFVKHWNVFKIHFLKF